MPYAENQLENNPEDAPEVQASFDVPLMLRENNAEDTNFILATWNRNARNAIQYWGCPDTLFFHFHNKYIVRPLMARSRCIILCDEKFPDQIVGYAVYEVVEGPTLVFHMVYIRRRYRRNGFARGLVRYIIAVEQPTAVMYSYKNQTMHTLATKVLIEELGDWIYNPFLQIVDLNEPYRT